VGRCLLLPKVRPLCPSLRARSAHTAPQVGHAASDLAIPLPMGMASGHRPPLPPPLPSRTANQAPAMGAIVAAVLLAAAAAALGGADAQTGAWRLACLAVMAFTPPPPRRSPGQL
jgi:hypothetical protein